jgi:hypothetical protein
MVNPILSPRRRDVLRSALRLLPVAELLLLAGACQDVTAPPTALRPDAPEVGPVRRDFVSFAALDRAHWADGYAWANDPTNALYTPSTFYSFNRLGNAISVRKPGGSTGRYIVKFAGLSALLGTKSTVHVTGYLGDDNVCKPGGPALVGDSIEVRCYRASTKAAANAYFTLLVTRNYADVAFAYANQPTGNNYAPQANASWNPAGPIKVFHTGTGVYSVQFNGLGAYTGSNGGHVQVNAVGTTKQQQCKVGGWGGSPNLSISVLCFGGAGVPTNSEFNVLFVFPSDHLAYAWADQPSTASYTPSTFYSSNPSGGSITISRLATGRYNVTWTGADPYIFDGGDVQVTAYGGGAAECKVEGWGSESATIRCFMPNGTLVDSYFDVLLGS